MTMSIALVGLGRISKRHIEAIQANSNLKITQVCDNCRRKPKNTLIFWDALTPLIIKNSWNRYYIRSYPLWHFTLNTL